MLIEVTKNFDNSKFIFDSSLVEKIYPYKKENKRTLNMKTKKFTYPEKEIEYLTKIHLKPSSIHYYNDPILLVVKESYDEIKEILGNEIHDRKI